MSRAGEVWARIASVTDPELDEPVTELGFVTGVSYGRA
jgi:metal-sulfur cluster biosynthetic enzyme